MHRTAHLPARGLLCLLAVAGPVVAQPADPLRTRNLNPPVAVLGLPSWQNVPDGRVFGVVMELANHYRLTQRGSDVLILDGETVRVNVFYEQPFGRGWSFGAEMPFYRQSGGFLDDVIDAWHSAFGLPDGGRNNRPEDALLYQMTDGATLFDLRESAQGIGDLKLSLARRIGADGRYVVRGAVKLATGKESMLAGSGSNDWMLTLLRARSGTLGGRPSGFFWGLGLLGLGRPEPVPFEPERSGAVGLIGGGIGVTRRVGFKAQLEVHTPLYDSPVEEVGQTAVQLSLGGWWSLAGGGVLDFAVIEDLHVSTAPDVVIHVGLKWTR